MNMRRNYFLAILLIVANFVVVKSQDRGLFPKRRPFAGAVYVMTNDVELNSIIAYGRQVNGTLKRIGSFPTGGQGAIIDDLDGIDPLFSAYSVIPTPDNRFLIAVNAGSRTVSVFRIRKNFKLCLVSLRRVSGSGPVSLAFHRGILYVASAEASTIFDFQASPFSIRGALTGFKLLKSGRLARIRNSVRRLPFRPSAIKFTKDGRSLVVTSLSAGTTDLNSTSVDEISVFRVRRSGLLSNAPIDTAASTLPNNEEGRSLPGAIGLEIAKVNGSDYAIVAEARFSSSDGAGVNPQVSSVSIWRVTPEQRLVPVDLDVLVGTSLESGQIAACWVELSKNKKYFWSANTISGTLSSFSLEDGKATLVEEVAGNPAVPVDLWLSSDGKFLYQLNNAAVDVYEVEKNGFGPGLTLVQTVTDIPEENVQGIVAI